MANIMNINGNQMYVVEFTYNTYSSTFHFNCLCCGNVRSNQNGALLKKVQRIWGKYIYNSPDPISSYEDVTEVFPLIICETDYSPIFPIFEGLNSAPSPIFNKYAYFRFYQNNLHFQISASSLTTRIPSNEYYCYFDFGIPNDCILGVK